MLGVVEGVAVEDTVGGIFVVGVAIVVGSVVVAGVVVGASVKAGVVVVCTTVVGLGAAVVVLSPSDLRPVTGP